MKLTKKYSISLTLSNKMTNIQQIAELIKFHSKTIGLQKNAAPATNVFIKTVASMQQAILNFKQAALSNPLFAQTDSGNKEKSSYQYTPKQNMVDTENDIEQSKQKDTLTGYRAFGNVMINNYFPKEKMSKVETDVSTDMNDPNYKPSGNTVNIENILDTINKIGTQSKDGLRQPDGKWGNRTQNALLLICGLCEAIEQLSFDMIQKEIFGQDLKQLNDKIPQTIPEVIDATPLAAELTTIINKLTSKLEGFKAELINNSTFKDYISQKNSVANINKKQKVNADPNLDVILTDGKNSINVKIEDISSINRLFKSQNFQKYLKNLWGSEYNTNIKDHNKFKAVLETLQVK